MCVAGGRALKKGPPVPLLKINQGLRTPKFCLMYFMDVPLLTLPIENEKINSFRKCRPLSNSWDIPWSDDCLVFLIECIYLREALGNRAFVEGRVVRTKVLVWVVCR